MAKDYNRKQSEKSLEKGRRIAKIQGFKDVEKRAHKLRDTKVPCSCSMCGNPRKFLKGEEKLTIQERKSNEN